MSRSRLLCLPDALGGSSPSLTSVVDCMATMSQFRLASSLCAVLLMSAGCTPTHHAEQADVIWHDDPKLRIDLPAARARLRQGLQSGQIDRLVVLHTRNGLVNWVNVSSTVLERNFDYRLEIRRMADSPMAPAFLDALSRALPVPSDQVADLRWGYIFYKLDGTQVISAYCDGSGKRGVIDGACYTFEVGSLAELANSLFVKDMK